MFDFNAPLSDALPLNPMLLPADLMRMKKSGLLMEVTCVLFLLSSRLKSSFSSVVFDFNASLNDVAPVSPMFSPVDLMRMKKNGLLMDAVCVLFLLYLPRKFSFVSVVFDFNASFSDSAPVSPMLLSVDSMKTEKVDC